MGKQDGKAAKQVLFPINPTQLCSHRLSPLTKSFAFHPLGSLISLGSCGGLGNGSHVTFHSDKRKFMFSSLINFIVIFYQLFFLSV